MCLCGVVLWGIFCRLKQCWNLFNLFVKERETWMVQNSPLLGRYLWQLCQGFLRITFLSAVSRNGMTRKAPLCFSSFCSHCLYHNSFNMLSMTNWRRVCGRCGKKKIFWKTVTTLYQQYADIYLTSHCCLLLKSSLIILFGSFWVLVQII